MEFSSYLDLLNLVGLDLELDPLTGVEVSYGNIASVAVDPLGGTDVSVASGLVDVGVGVIEGVTVDVGEVGVGVSPLGAVDVGVGLFDIGVDPAGGAVLNTLDLVDTALSLALDI